MRGARIGLAVALVATGLAAIIAAVLVSWEAAVLALAGATGAYLGGGKVDVEPRRRKPPPEPPFSARSAL